jgi:CO/xanthine dehydrogenase FAD-binding subunit
MRVCGHVSVQIEGESFLKLKAYLRERAQIASLDEIVSEVSFPPFATGRRQVFVLVRATNSLQRPNLATFIPRQSGFRSASVSLPSR